MKAHSFTISGISFLFALMLFSYGCSGGPKTAPKTYVVEIKDMQFQPAQLTVNKGDTVVWINKDIVLHDVTEINKAWASPPLPQDAEWKKVITKSESYFCSIHMVMKGELIVE